MKYDKIVKDGTVVEKIEKKEKSEIVSTKTPESININVKDVLDTLYGYINPYFHLNSNCGHNTCIICGNETNSDLRKMCVDCVAQYGVKIHDESIKAIDNEKTSFVFKK